MILIAAMGHNLTGFDKIFTPMNSLNATLVRDFTRYYQEARDKIHTLLKPLSDDQIWARPFPYGNSIGHLLLHLTGNLSYYIGTEIGGTGYIRNRPLQKQLEESWYQPYTAMGMEDAGNRFTAFLRCAGHISHHTGQMIYLCKELERQPQR